MTVVQRTTDNYYLEMDQLSFWIATFQLERSETYDLFYYEVTK